MSVVMILAGSRWQISIVQCVRKLGHKAVVVNPYEDSPAFEYADAYEICDILDKEKCLELARKHKVDAITSEQCEIALSTIDYVATKLGLPTIGKEFVELYTNKFCMREFARSHAMPFPEYRLCYSLDDALEFFSNLNSPMILKPLNNHSSRGVFTIRNEEDLSRFFPQALELTHHETKAVICERYISGPEFSVDGIMTSEGHVSLAVSHKEHYPHNQNVACALSFSNSHPDFDYDELRRCNDAYVNATRLPWGLTHAEYKYENGKFYLIEIGARGGGNRISSHIVPAVSGINHNELLVRQALGERITKKDAESLPEYRDKAAILEFFQFPAGHVAGISGAEILDNEPGILDHLFNFKIGDTLELASDDNHRAGYYIATANSVRELELLRAKIKNHVKPIFD